jgi:hypothetical protein
MDVPEKNVIFTFIRVALNIRWYALFAIIGCIMVAIVLWGFFMPLPPPFEVENGFTIHADFLSITFERVEIGDQRLLVVGMLGLTVVSLAVAQTIVGQLRRIFSALRTGSPFTAGNARLIRAIGLVTIGGSVLSALVALLVGYLVTRAIAIPGLEPGIRAGSPMSGVFLGLVILALAEVFRRGAKLQEDQDLTI